MRFCVRNIKPGYCEIWANTRNAQRYQKLAVIVRDGKMWSWHAKEKEPPFYMPFRTNEFTTRNECVWHCERTALLKQAERAIAKVKDDPDLMQHWHCPTRDALNDMITSMLFTHDEIDDMRERMGL